MRSLFRVTRRQVLKTSAKGAVGLAVPGELLQLGTALADPVGSITAAAGEVISKKVIEGAADNYLSNIRNGIDWITNAINRNFEDEFEVPKLRNTDLIVRIEFDDFARAMIEAMRFGFHEQEDRDAIIHSPEMREMVKNMTHWKTMCIDTELLLHNCFDPGSLQLFVKEGYGRFRETLKSWNLAELPLDHISDMMPAIPGWSQKTPHEKMMAIFELKFIYRYGLPSQVIDHAASLDIARFLKKRGAMKTPDIAEMLTQFGPATIEKAFIASRKLGHELLGKTAEEAEKLAQDEYDRRHKETYFEIRRHKREQPSRRAFFSPVSFDRFEITLTDCSAAPQNDVAIKTTGQVFSIPADNAIASVMAYLLHQLDACDARNFSVQYDERGKDSTNFSIMARGDAARLLDAIAADRTKRLKSKMNMNAFYSHVTRPVDTANWLTLAAAIKTRTATNALG